MANNESPAKTGKGYLIVRASTARGAIPVEGATVTVREHLPGESATGVPSPRRGNILLVQTTNRDGNTERMELYAPPKADSLSPYGGDAFETYNIEVESKGYYPLYFSNVPIYDGITSIQPAVLIPISENGNDDGATMDDGFFYESVNPDLKE